jgi:hypothetical protein
LILVASHNNQVSENEFFATTQKGMDALLTFKEAMMNAYSR